MIPLAVSRSSYNDKFLRRSHMENVYFYSEDPLTTDEDDNLHVTNFPQKSALNALISYVRGFEPNSSRFFHYMPCHLE